MLVVGARKQLPRKKKNKTTKNNDELEKRTKCNRCCKVGHWEHECLDDDVLED
jgi:hypothetical protein